ALVQTGHEVIFFSIDVTPELQRRAWDELGVRAEVYSLSRTGMNPFADLRNSWDLYRSLKKIKPDLVFCYFAKPVIWGAMAARLAGIQHRYGMLEGLGYYFTDDPNGNSRKKNLVRAILVALFRFSLPMLKGLVVLNPDDKRDLIEKYRIHQKNVMV